MFRLLICLSRVLIIHKYITVACTRPGYDRNIVLERHLTFSPVLFLLFPSFFSLFLLFSFLFLLFSSFFSLSAFSNEAWRRLYDSRFSVFTRRRGVDRGGFNDNYRFGARNARNEKDEEREERTTGLTGFEWRMRK